MTKSNKSYFPGFRKIDRYITRKFLGTYFFAIALIVVIVVVFDAVEKIDDFMKAPLKSIMVDYYLNFIPFFVNQFSGLFTFIAVIFFTSKMAYNTEIIAILSSGVSFKRLLWPYLVSATVITMLSISLNLYVIPSANKNRVEFEREYFRRNRNIDTRYDRHIYRQIYPGAFVYIRGFSGATDKAEFLAIEQYEESTIVGMLEASSVTLNRKTGHWTAPRYVTRKFEGEKEVFESHVKLDTAINLDVMELGKLSDIIQTMPIGELNQFISQQKAKGSDMLALFEVERQNRFAYPAACFILTIIGLSLSSRKVRGGTGLHIGIGIALCFTYIMFCKFAEEFAKNSSAPPILMVWTPNMIFAFIAVYLYRKAPK